MSRVAFVGLGVMGLPMAGHLVKAGHEVVGWNRSTGALDDLVAAGGLAAASLADAVRGADVVITVLPDGPDVEAVTFGENGIHALAGPGTLHIDCSTISPEASRRIAEQGEAKQIRTIDAPVSGGQAGAIAGNLSVMVGGDADNVAAAQPYLEAFGTTIVHVGPVGSGQIVKAANQLIVAGNIEFLAEALLFLEAHGVDTTAAGTVLQGGLAGSTVLERKLPSMQARSFAPGFRAVLHRKDLRIAVSAAQQAGIALPLGSRVADLMNALVEAGDGDLDHAALLRGVERQSSALDASAAAPDESPVQILLQFRSAPGKSDELVGVLKDGAVAARQREGNLVYSIYRDENDPEVVFLHEGWATVSNHKAHSENPAHRANLDLVKPLLGGPPTMTRLRGA